MIANVKATSGHSYTKVSEIGQSINEILSNKFYLTNDFIEYIQLYEKRGCKFSKPSNVYSNEMRVYICGWRLVGQQRGMKDLPANLNMYGKDINLGTDNMIYPPSATAVHTVKTPEGLVVAEIIDKNVVNILFDICELDSESINFILLNIFKDIVEGYYAINLSEIQRRRIIEEQDKVSTFLLKLASKRLIETKNCLDAVESKIRSLENDLVEYLDQRRRYLTDIVSLQEQSNESVAKLRDELNALCSLDKIVNVTISNNESIIFTTSKIYITNANKRYYIGEFDIEVKPNSADVIFKNKGNCRQSAWGEKCHHPHVDTRGHACWGNVKTAIQTYIRQNEWQALLSLLLGFLESVNTTDAAGRYITCWDVVNNSGDVIQKGYHPSRPPVNTEIYRCYECADMYSVDNIVLSEGTMHICRHCSDKYFKCPECGEILKLEDGTKCDRCDVLMCEDCAEDNPVCPTCVVAEERIAQLQEGQSICPHCNEIVNDDELLTCETCGEQGCGQCITFDGRYACPQHR